MSFRISNVLTDSLDHQINVLSTATGSSGGSIPELTFTTDGGLRIGGISTYPNISEMSSDCIAIGNGALNALTDDGGGNIAIGDSALENGTNMSNNIAIGDDSLQNCDADYNIAIGYNCMENTYDSEYNVVIGHESLAYGTGCAYNVCIGNNSLVNLESGDNNAVLGYNSGSNLSNGNNNIVLGNNVDTMTSTSSNTISIGNVAIETACVVSGVLTGTHYVKVKIGAHVYRLLATQEP